MTEREMKLAELEAVLESSRADCERISEEMQESRKNTRKDALNNLRSARSEYNTANLKHEKADDARDACRAALCSCVIGQRDPVEVRAEVEADVKKSLEFKKSAERKIRLWPVIVSWAVAIAYVIIGIILFGEPMLWEALCFAVLGALIALGHKKAVDYSKTAEEHRNAILAKYKADDEEIIKAQEKEFLELHRAFAEAEELERSTAAYLEQCRIKLEELENRTLDELDFSSGNSEAAELTRLFNERSQICQDLAMEIEKLKNQ